MTLTMTNLRRAGLAALLGGSLVLAGSATATADPLVPGTAVSFADEVTPGYLVQDAVSGTVLATGLFEFTTESGGTHRAYCLEFEVPISTTSDEAKDAVLATWDEYLGTNAFKSNPLVGGTPTRELVSWIALNSYPAVSLEAFAAAAGAPGLTEAQAVTATQAAIWHLTDGLEYGRAFTRHNEPLPAWAEANIRAGYDYLLGDANTGSPESSSIAAQLAVSGPAQATAGDLVGPFTVSTTLAAVELSVAPAGATLVDAAGLPVSSTAANGTTVYVHLPAGLDAETVRIEATGTATEVGSAIINTRGASPRYDHQQTVIVSSSTTATVSASAATQITPAATPTPTPTPTPTDTPTPTPTTTPTPTATAPAPTSTAPAPSATTPADTLATTGEDAAVPFALGAAALVVLGGAALALVGRRRADSA